MKQCYETIKVEMIPLNWILGRGFQFRDSFGVSYKKIMVSYLNSDKIIYIYMTEYTYDYFILCCV